MATTAISPDRGGPLPWSSRLLARRTATGVPPAVCAATLRPGLRIPMEDGTHLVADHYLPEVATPAATILIRTPYGRGFPWGHLFGTTFARWGFQVLLTSCRGTAGSGGHWRPFRDEAEDGRDVVAWLRGQPWFDGRLATVGPSYLGFTQLALAAQDVPEWRAAVLLAPAVRPATATWTGGVFTLESALVTGLARVQGNGIWAFTRGALRLARRVRRIARELPLIESYRSGFSQRSDVFEDFLTHPDPADPFWAGTDLASRAADLPATLLVGGWWDILLEQTLELYARRAQAERSGSATTRLLIGPWTHTTMLDAGWPEVSSRVLAFLRAQLEPAEPSGGQAKGVLGGTGDGGTGDGGTGDGGTGDGGTGDSGTGDVGKGGARVRVHVGGSAGWRELDAWPPSGCRARTWTMTSGGGLTAGDPGPGDPSVIRYDPADPTPSAAGATLGRPAGVVDNARIERRPDVLLFTSAPLEREVEVVGDVEARLRLRVSGAGADAFVRLCDVDPAGVSRNVCDGILRLDPYPDVFRGAGGTVTVRLGAASHRFARGHRIRVQVSGGAHPRFARNTGTREAVATAVHLRPATIEVLHEAGAASAVVLPENA